MLAAGTETAGYTKLSSMGALVEEEDTTVSQVDVDSRIGECEGSWRDVIPRFDEVIRGAAGKNTRALAEGTSHYGVCGSPCLS